MIPNLHVKNGFVDGARIVKAFLTYKTRLTKSEMWFTTSSSDERSESFPVNVSRETRLTRLAICLKTAETPSPSFQGKR